MKYKIPIDSKEEEKAIGGMLTFKQFGWLAVGFLIGLAVAGFTFILTSNGFISILFSLIPLGVTIPFAFVKLHDMSLLNYIYTKHKFNKKNKKLYNIKGGQ